MRAPTETSPSDRGGKRRLRVLVLSRNYPNSVFPYLGLWVQGLVRGTARLCDVKVISPVPYCPPLPGLDERIARFRRVERQGWADGAEIFYPRFVLPPGIALHGTESLPYYLAVRGLVARLHQQYPFDLIHAHFTFPDGWVAARLARKYGVPSIITEQAAWHPWMDDYAVVRRQALWAARQCTFHIAISQFLRKTIADFTGDSPKLRVIPDCVDAEVYRLAEDGVGWKPDQILFVGTIRHVKGVDVLLRAIKLLVKRGRAARLILVGESFYRNYQQDYAGLMQMAKELKLNSHVKFAGGKPVEEVVRAMQQSALLVLPSRRETLGMVLAEAMACGTPVVATRCGGPEDIVTDRVGILVPPEDPAALADAIERVLNERARFDPRALRAYSLENFGIEVVAERLVKLYREAVALPA